MSFTFELVADSAAPIRFADLQGSIGLPMDTVEELPADDAVHGLVHVYQPGLTTRAIELNVEGRYVDVRILTCSSPEDY